MEFNFKYVKCEIPVRHLSGNVKQAAEYMRIQSGNWSLLETERWR